MILPVSAFAQSVEDDVILDDDDTIVVTARKRAESIQDVPLAITAFTDSDIRERSLNQLEDVALQTPGLTFEDFSNGAYGAPVIRGASQIRIDQLEQNVSVFYDGVYIPRQYAFDLGMTNIQRIEVVKGPQSALYGANSFAGAINYVSKDRDLQNMTGQISGGAGLNGLLEANGYISVPVIKDVLAISASGALTEFDGDFDNEYPGASNAPNRGTDESVGGWDKETYGAGFTLQTQGFTAKLDYNKFNALNEDGANFRLNREFREVDFNCSPDADGVNQAICGALPDDVSDLQNPSGINGLLIDPRSHTDVETEMIRGELGYQFNDNFSINYLYGDIESEIFATSEATRDATLDFVFFGNALGAVMAFAPSGYVDYATHELRLDYENDSGLTATVGGFIMDGEDVDAFSNVFVPLFLSDDATSQDPIEAPDLSEEDPLEVENKAVFAAVNIPLLDQRLILGLEGRYTEAEKRVIDDGVEYVFEDEFFTPRVSLDYNFDDNTLLYASYAKGVKAGGINTSSAVLLDEERFFDNDVNDTFEVGAKLDLLGGRANLNTALYYIDWDDLQASLTPANASSFTGAIVSNIGGATSKGFEVDGTIDLSDAFTFNAGFSYTDAEYKDGTTSASRGLLCPVGSNVCLSDENGDAIIGGNDVARVPGFQWNYGGQYNGELGSDMDYFVRLDVAGQSSQNVTEVGLAQISGRQLLNLRGGLTRGPVSVDLWVTNLLDEEYVSNAFTVVSTFDTSYIPAFGPARRGGVRLTYDF